MKKNALLTFIFACIPGAGQMYYGYMQRGLAIVSLFGAAFMVSNIFNPFVITLLIFWMYSFFDTYDLIRHLAAGEPKEDSLLLLGKWQDCKELIPQHNQLLGWGLIIVGGWAMYDTVVSNWLANILNRLFSDYGIVYSIIHGIPNVFIAVLLIAAGFKLLGLHPAAPAANNDLPPFPGEDDHE